MGYEKTNKKQCAPPDFPKPSKPIGPPNHGIVVGGSEELLNITLILLACSAFFLMGFVVGFEVSATKAS